eukprot:GHVU01203292.1.p1 GENE.GHVU01203292.1~~GHVU01203292.1.p1  ORF type:complete len:120 (+),score=3.47 GHVU01203292.1:336-695(+)
MSSRGDTTHVADTLATQIHTQFCPPPLPASLPIIHMQRAHSLSHIFIHVRTHLLTHLLTHSLTHLLEELGKIGFDLADGGLEVAAAPREVRERAGRRGEFEDDVQRRCRTHCKLDTIGW